MTTDSDHLTRTVTDGGTGAPRGPVPFALPAALVGGLALAASNACVALVAGEASLDTTADVVTAAAEHGTLTELTSAFALLASLLLVPATWAVVGGLRRSVPRLAGMGGWLMASGYVMFTALSFESLVVLAVAREGGDPGVLVRAIDEHTSMTSIGAYAVLGLGALVGGVVLGLAMVRHPAVPSWAGWALVVSEPVRVAGLLAGVPWLPVLASLLLTLALVQALRRRH